LRAFSYDDENQLIQVLMTNQWKSQFSYDGKMRRRIRQEFTWQGEGWVQTNAVYYIYDGNLVIQERDVNNLPTTTYTRGVDLSGSLDGAGGIGGLLARTAQSYVDAPLAGHAFYHADRNGNVTMLINSSQAVVAKYLYDSFGNVLSASGLLANANRFQFSSKEKDLNSGLAYYLYRYYDPNLQRWLNRDPIGEKGGINLYTFNRNNPLRFVDPFGLTTYVWPPEDTPPGTYGPTATVVNDGSDAVLPAVPYLTDSQGLGSADGDALLFFPELIPGAPAIGKALGAAADAVGNAAKDALDALGLGKPKLPAPPAKCPPPKPPGWKPDWEKGISSRSNTGKPGGESWWDPNGGEYHYHDVDPWHPDAHWDYNPWDQWNSPWQNIDQQGNVIPKNK
jgi:RHS repeat-associated protein